MQLSAHDVDVDDVTPSRCLPTVLMPEVQFEYELKQSEENDQFSGCVKVKSFKN